MQHRGALSIDAFMLMKEEFLDDPGCEPDFETIEAAMEDGPLPDREMLSAWFDVETGRVRQQTEFEVHRHITVPDYDMFVSHVADGGDTGEHWSEDTDTWSHYADALGCNVRISGTVMAECVDWFSTFQCRLAFPAERELVFLGPVTVTSVRNIDDDLSWNPGSGFTQPTLPKP